MSTQTTSAIYLRMPAALRRQMDKAAAANRRSLTQEALIALEAHVAAEKEKTT